MDCSINSNLPRRQQEKVDLFFSFTSFFDLFTRFLNDVCLWQMMLATPVMTASPNDAWLRHILRQTSHHCVTKWSNIIFAKQMHHIAVGDASSKNIYALIYLQKCDIINSTINKNLADGKKNGIVELVKKQV